MSFYINQIEKKIKNNIQLEEIKIIDNTDAHRNHKSFQKGKLHLILEIKSNYLKNLKAQAEKIIMKIMENELQKNICTRNTPKIVFLLNFQSGKSYIYIFPELFFQYHLKE